MPILSVAHACIKTASLDQTEAFYRGGLGLEKKFDFTRRGQVIGFYLKASNHTFIEVFLDNAVENTDQHCLDADRRCLDAARRCLDADRRCLSHFCLETDDLEGTRRRLAEQGWKPGEIKTGADRTPQFWVTDPNGLAVEFQQYTPESAQHTGQAVEVNW